MGGSVHVSRRYVAPARATALVSSRGTRSPRVSLGIAERRSALTGRSRIRHRGREMKQFEAVARESLEILNGIPHGVALLDGDCRMMAMNSHLEALTGHASAEVRGIPGDHVIRSRSSHEKCSFGEAVRTGAPVSMESDLLSADRRRVP